jgi:hypothetical protein
MDKYVVKEEVCIIIDGKLFVEAKRVNIIEAGFALLEKQPDAPIQKRKYKTRAKKEAAEVVFKQPAEKKERAPAIAPDEVKEMVEEINNGGMLKDVLKNHATHRAAFMKLVKDGGYTLKIRRGRRPGAGARENMLHCNDCDHEWPTAMDASETTCENCSSANLMTV